MRKFAKLRGIMMEHGDDAEHLARALLLSRTSVSLRMTGKAQWTIDEMWKIMNRYRIPADQMAKVFPEGGISA